MGLASVGSSSLFRTPRSLKRPACGGLGREASTRRTCRATCDGSSSSWRLRCQRCAPVARSLEQGRSCAEVQDLLLSGGGSRPTSRGGADVQEQLLFLSRLALVVNEYDGNSSSPREVPGDHSVPDVCVPDFARVSPQRRHRPTPPAWWAASRRATPALPCLDLRAASRFAVDGDGPRAASGTLVF